MSYATRTPEQDEAQRQRIISRNREIVRRAKTQPCADCGYDFPWYVMEFDHVRGEKLATVGQLMGRRSLRALLEEMDKCDVVCANCHKARTFLRANGPEAY